MTRSIFQFFCGLILLPLSGCSGLLYYPSRHLHFDPAQFQLKPEEVHFTSADGTKLFGWLFRAGQARPKGVFILYHGNAENLSSHYLNMIWVLKEGYDLFAFDYRGYGRSEGSPSPEGTVRDGEAALRWLHARYPKTPLVIMGQSLGGAIALRNAVDLKAEIPFKAVVLEGAFASYRGIARDVLTRSWISWPFQWLGWLVMSDRYSADGEIGKISPVPLLVMHAEGDGVVPLKFGEKIFWQAGEPRTLWKIPGDGHTDVFYRHGAVYQQKLLGWLAPLLKRDP